MLLKEKSIQKVFLTGGAGFIGSHVADILLSFGYSVTVFDNLSSGNIAWVNKNLGNPNYKFIEADLLDYSNLIIHMNGHDLVWHLAANTDIPGGFVKTDIDLKNCIIATYNVMEAMRQLEITKILFSSTGAIYGELCRRVSVTEEVGPLLPLSLYAAGKLGSEGIISAYCSLFGINGWIFRFGNVVGARMSHGVIFDFVRKLKSNSNELLILGDGKQEKNYFLVEECVQGMIFAFNNVRLDENKPCDIFNLGTDTVSNVVRIGEIIIEEMGLRDVKMIFSGGETGWPGDQPQVHILANKMHELGWKTKYSSDEAIRIATRRILEKE